MFTLITNIDTHRSEKQAAAPVKLLNKREKQEVNGLKKSVSFNEQLSQTQSSVDLESKATEVATEADYEERFRSESSVNTDSSLLFYR